MTHAEFLDALHAQVRAYQILHAALARACEPEFARLFLMDPFTRAAQEEFAAPLAEWFPAASGVIGLTVEDGTIVFDPGPAFTGAVYFLAGIRAPGPRELPSDWRARAAVVASFDGDPAFRIGGRMEAESAPRARPTRGGEVR